MSKESAIHRACFGTKSVGGCSDSGQMKRCGGRRNGGISLQIYNNKKGRTGSQIGISLNDATSKTTK